MWCPTCQIHRDFSDEIHPIKLSNEYNLNAELQRLKIPVLDKSKISWFLKKVQGNEDDLPGIIFLNELSDVIAKSNANEKTIIIYGEKAAEFADHISSDNRCQFSSIPYRNDKYEILEKLQKATNTREKQINRYNYPSQTLF
jgi:hydroxymethylpyrimidine pyrophosphatase-like HAD family hydrolase